MYIYAPSPTPAPPLFPTLPIRGSSLRNKLACLQRAAFSGITFLSGSKDHVGLSDCLTRHCGGGGGRAIETSRSRPGNVCPILSLMDWNKRVRLWCGRIALIETLDLIRDSFSIIFDTQEIIRISTLTTYCQGSEECLLLITTSSFNYKIGQWVFHCISMLLVKDFVAQKKNFHFNKRVENPRRVGTRHVPDYLICYHSN